MTLSWTQEEAIAFVCAKDCITDLIAVLLARQNEASNAAEVQALWDRISQLSQERSTLGIHDHEEVARIEQEYGVIVREDMAQLRA